MPFSEPFCPALPLSDHFRLKEVADLVAETPTDLYIVPDVWELATINAAVGEFVHTPDTLVARWWRGGRRCREVGLAGAGLRGLSGRPGISLINLGQKALKLCDALVGVAGHCLQLGESRVNLGGDAAG